MKLMVLMVVALSCACATEYEWTGDKTPQDFYRDRAECTAMSNSGPNRSNAWNPRDNMGYTLGRAFENSGNSRNRAQLFNDCMMGNGWHLAKKVF